jgi:4-deoxy-L-threo-5-hexosulose-uronate ketol-isomerase
MNILQAVHPDDFRSYSTKLVRERFLIEELMQPGQISFTYAHYDRMMVGGAVPLKEKLVLETFPILRSEYFLERREMGIINVGGAAIIHANGQEYQLEKLDGIYIGKGHKDVTFASADTSNPAMLYILSAPAHAEFPVQLIRNSETDSNIMGAMETSNHRTIYRYIHKAGVRSCQLVMGLTLLEKGSVWNTIPPHTHDRRMEVYFYFDLPQNQVVFHYMGTPDETRHIIMKDHQAVVSPPWSIHAGSATSNYGFIWGMAGENLEYTDMDAVNLNDLK